MRKLTLAGLVLVLILGVQPMALAGDVSAQSAFERLASLEGTWTGLPEGEGEEAKAEAEAAGQVTHEIEVSAAGTVIMETMNPGTEHEMINMYHRDGNDLVLSHYCSGGNQPQMRLDPEASSLDTLVFAYSGGTNHDPAVDQHIHSAEIELIDDNHLKSHWSAHAGGEEVGRMMFDLARSE